MILKRLLLLLLLAVCATSIHAATTLTWWQFWTDPTIKPVIESMVAEFEADNPDIKVELIDLTWANGHEKIVIAFGSNTGPDIVELGSDWIAEFAAGGWLTDMSPKIAQDSADFDGWQMATYGGKVYAYPWILGTRVLFCNGRLLERAGYDSLFAPVTLNDLRTAAQKVGVLGSKRYGWGSNAPEKHRLYKKFLPFLWTSGAQILSDDGQYCVLPSENAINALKQYKELHDEYGFVGSQREIEDEFLAGNIGFILSGDWLLKRIEREKPDIKFFATLMPGQKRPGLSFMGGEFLAVNAASKNADAAMRFIRFITSPENQVKFCKASGSTNPSSEAAQEDDYFQSNIDRRTFIQQMRFARPSPTHPDWVYFEQAIEEAVENVVFKSKAPGEALLEAQQKIEKSLSP